MVPLKFIHTEKNIYVYIHTPYHYKKEKNKKIGMIKTT